MPQFDFYCFSVQVFWTLSTFFIFYFYCLQNLISKLCELLKIRSKLLKTIVTNKNVLHVYSSCFEFK